MPAVRTRLVTAPVWVAVLVVGGFFALAMALAHRVFDGTDWSSALAGGGMGGLVYGALMAPVLYRQRRRVRNATGELPNAQIPSAVRASLRGPVPADPRVRAAAARLAVQQGELLTRQRVWGVPFFVVLTATASWLALTDSPWWWAAVAAFLAVLGSQLFAPRRYRRRARLLEESAASV